MRHRSEQGTISPKLFIGLGGVGSRIVDRIARQANGLPNWDTQLKPLTHFVSVDTNDLDQNKLASIPSGNRINIAAFDKQKVMEGYRRSKDSQALQWLDYAYNPRPGFKPGAGQIRVESRLGFFYNSTTIRERLSQLVRVSLAPGITWRQSNPPKYNVHIYCSLGGGTGSGSFLSMAYLITDVIHRQDWQPRLMGNFLLSTLLKGRVGPELANDTHANSYAALKEMEHLTKLDYPQIKEEGRTSEPFVYCRGRGSVDIPRVMSRPFFMSWIIDQPAHISISDPEKTVADASYLQVFTPVLDELSSELDNYEKRLDSLTRFPGELRNIGQGYTKNFGAFGVAACILPAEDLLQYSALRFAAEAIRRQITFGLDKGVDGDDRSRALARLAIDYSDPKFLRMSDEIREGKINSAFVSSVQEMARLDVSNEIPDGYWNQLVESIDEGTITGVDDKGAPTRRESILETVVRRLKEARSIVLNKISITERAFVFHREGVSQYPELVSRMAESIRTGRTILDEGLVKLEGESAEGEVVTKLGLDPIAERYLALRLLTQIEGTYLPAALKQQEDASIRDISNPKVRERLEVEYYESLKQVAGSRNLFGRKDKQFLDLREEVQDYYRGVARAAKRYFEALCTVRQLKSLQEYLHKRARQYARLATSMEVLVSDLEREAEGLRRGDRTHLPGLSLRVEVFQTLDEPKTRLWDEVYRRLYIDDGRHILTFDRQVLAKAISVELRPTARGLEKSTEQTVSDVRRAMMALGQGRLRPALFGSEGLVGLDLASGLELEAEIILEKKQPKGSYSNETDKWAYIDKKLRAVAQLAGPLARASLAEHSAVDDGVIVNRTRLCVIGSSLLDVLVEGERDALAVRFKEVLQDGGLQVKMVPWYDPRVAIVHDVVLPVPLYYFPAVVGDLEGAYIAAERDERRTYSLHTDFNWEKSLPNLNPRSSEISIGWSLSMFRRGIVSQVLTMNLGEPCRWNVDENTSQILGGTLSAVLYEISKIHRNEELRKSFQDEIERAENEVGKVGLEKRRSDFFKTVERTLLQMNLADLRQPLSREQLLDRPIMKALLQSVEGDDAQFKDIPSFNHGFGF